MTTPKAIIVTPPGENPPGNVNDVDALKAAMLALETQLQGLTTSGLSRSDFDAAFLKLTTEQGKLSKDFTTALERMGVLETSVATKTRERLDDGENISDWLLGFW